MLVVAMAGTFASSLAAPLRAALRVPCDVFAADETQVVAELEQVDVLVTMAFTRAMGAAAQRLKLVQVPGAGLERIDRSALPPGAGLAGKTRGILGYGRIGRELARRARAFDMEVCAIRRDVARSAADGLALLGGLEILDEVLRRADYLTIALPATAATRGLIGEPQ